VTPEPEPLDHDTYIQELLDRFANPALLHRTRQIAMDGSQKLPQRLLHTVRAQLKRGGPIAGLSLAVAAWMRYATGRDESGKEYAVDDPLAERFARVSAQTPADPAELAAGFLDIREIFGADLPQNPRFRSTVTESLRQLLEQGAAATVAVHL
jgi:fructuronate reductase